MDTGLAVIRLYNFNISALWNLFNLFNNEMFFTV